MVQNTTYRIVLFFLDDKFIIDFKQKERCLIPFFPDHTPQSPAEICYKQSLLHGLYENIEFAILRAFRAFVLDVPSRLTRIFAFVPSLFTYFRGLRSLPAYVPSCLTCLDLYAP